MKLNSFGRILSLVLMLTLAFALTVAFTVTAGAEVEPAADESGITFASFNPHHDNTCGRAKITWKAVDGAVKYRVYFNGEHIANSSAAFYIFSDLDVADINEEPNTFSIKVVALNADNQTIASGVYKNAAAAHNYDYNVVVTDPTCTEQGYTTHTCDCGEFHVDTYVDALNHDPLEAVAENVVLPTCTEDGSHDDVVYCARCNDELERTPVVDTAYGHDYGELIAKIEPTCVNTGVKEHYNCSRCNKNFDAEKNELSEIVIPANGHAYGNLNAKVEPDCTNEGTIAYYECADCHTLFNENKVAVSSLVIPVLGHDWKAATCTAPKTCNRCAETSGDPAGHRMSERTCTEGEVCSVCGAEGEGPLGHDIINNPAKDPTCLDRGNTAYETCSRCSYKAGFEPIAPLGHDWKEATCLDPKTCQRDGCGVTEGEALGHDWEAATCTDPKTCKVCSTTEGEANGHNWKDATCTDPKTCRTCRVKVGEPNGHTWSEPTCTQDAKCTVCNTKGESKLGHDLENHAAKAPTCTEGGWNAYQTCSRCDYTNGYRELPALEHDMVEATCISAAYCQRNGCDYTEGKALGHTGNQATCTEDAVCTTCGATFGYATGHNWKAATCTTAKTCTTCKTKEGKALGHTWKDANCTDAKTCTTCNATEGKALGHEWTEATCQTPKTCNVCKATEGEVIDHNFQPDTNPDAATVYEYCECCGEKGKLVSAQVPEKYKKTILKVSVILVCTIVVILCIRGLTRPATTTPWYKRRR